jgi:hypothetical protein
MPHIPADDTGAPLTPDAITSAKTEHTCNDGRGPHFGRLTPGCPRCDQLAAGDPPRALGWVERRDQQARYDEQREAAHRNHFRVGGPHATGACGPVCTFGDW